MRTMASVWFSVIVLISIQNVYGDVCLKKINELSCNECIRCGGDWCNKPKTNSKQIGVTSPHCDFPQEDDWCPNDRESLPQEEEVMKPGDLVNPVYVERTLFVGKPNRLDIHYIAKIEQKAKMMIVQSTQSFNIELKEYDRKCSGINCTTTIEATPSQDFCNVTGGISETVLVKVNVGSDEEVHVKYFVPCACACSLKVQKFSPSCNMNGDYSCGACSCYEGWTGEFCDILQKKTNCDGKRGDIVQCSINPKNDADCSGNGYCGPCETCICYTDREGFQYFDQENNCADLCYQITSECEDCLLNNTAGECNTENCHHSLIIDRYNETLTMETDENNRKIWVTCNDTIDDCRIDYVARKSEDGEIHVMIVRSCNDVTAVAIVGATPVPIILGVLGVIAAVAAVGGVMLWKHMNTVPPVPLNDPQYQNIDAEDCTGENPLYKPPTSSFKNPTYGKW